MGLFWTSKTNRNLDYSSPHDPHGCGHSPLKQKRRPLRRKGVHCVSSIVITPVAPKCTFPAVCHANIPKAVCPIVSAIAGEPHLWPPRKSPRARFSGPGCSLAQSFAARSAIENVLPSPKATSPRRPSHVAASVCDIGASGLI